MNSNRFQLNYEDLKRVATNALVFSAPALILILGALQAGKSWEEIQGIVYLWALNTATDLLRKFLAGNTK